MAIGRAFDDNAMFELAVLRSVRKSICTGLNAHADGMRKKKGRRRSNMFGTDLPPHCGSGLSKNSGVILPVHLVEQT